MAQNINAQMVGTPYILTEIPSTQGTCNNYSTKGTDFWVTFGQNYNRTSLQVLLILKIATEEATNVTLNFTETGETVTLSNIAAYSLRTIDLSNVPSLGNKRGAVYNSTSGVMSGTTRKSLHITSTKPITVYAFNTGSATSDATVLMSTETWGNEYYRLSSSPYNDNDSYDVELIIAKEATVLTFSNGTTRNLSAGEVYYNTSATDMTGRRITSNKPVAYFAHTTLSAVPANRTFGDIIFEQIMPVDKWGTKFLVPNARQKGVTSGGTDIDNTMNNLVRIVASANATRVNFSGATRNGGQNITSGGTLNAGQYVELLLSSNTGACNIDTDKPVGVCAYLVGAGNNTNYLGDPAIAWIPPVNQTVSETIVAPFYPGTSANGGSTNLNHASSRHYATIITKTATKTQTKINNIYVTSGWTDNAASGYSYYVKQFNNTNDINSIFKIENPDGIIVLCHGTSNIESYYYNAGSGACIVN